MSTPTITLTRGLPGSGKTTWALQQEDKVRVSRDDIRYQLFDSYTNVDEDLVSSVEEATVRAALRAGYNVLVDAMHLYQKYINRWQKLGYPVEVVEFDLPIEALIARNAVRAKHVPESVIRQLHSKFTDRAGKLKSYRLAPQDFLLDYQYKSNLALPDGFMFDIDGTLAHMIPGGRNPYDYTRVQEDRVDPSVRAVASALDLEGAYIYVVTARDSACREETSEWLYTNGIEYDKLIMRADGDKRSDQRVKMEILRDQVAPEINVLGVFDDRPSVCDMWRRLGVKTFQVGDPEDRF